MDQQRLNQPSSFDILSPIARERLDDRVEQAGGNIEVVANEIRTQLETLDQQDGVDGEPQQQAERAFMVAQLDYLADLAQPSETETTRSGWFSRLRNRAPQQPA